MRIAIDARELCGHPTGVGRYLAGLLDGWSASGALQRHQITLIAHQPVDAARWRVGATVLRGHGGTLWEQTALSRGVAAERADVFFAPGYTAPLTVPTPIVLTIHDVSYFAHPEWFSFREGVRRRTLTKWAARRAHRVITDTEFSRSEIARHVGVDARVIPLGISDGHSHTGSLDRSQDSREGSRAPVVLFVGSLFQRRRVDRLIAAFARVAARIADARLEIVGDNRTQPPIDFDALRQRTGYADRIQLRSYVDDETLAALYRRASVFAFMSEYEGFGLTPLEALTHGVVPLLLDTPVARETCGEAARYVPADADDARIADELYALLSSVETRAALLQRRDAVVARFDWARTARETLAVLEEAALGR